ncbi:hypothetical protein BU15DRAFT_22703, partial [Melanogaster broomeanus]
IHYRLVLDVVGRPLTLFKSMKELVRGVLDAMQGELQRDSSVRWHLTLTYPAHWLACEFLDLLHRDINPGIITLTDDDRGLLIDWELAKTVSETGNRFTHWRYNSRRLQGTWQFMSAALLCKPHALEDDIESFLHVLGWVTIKYLPT